MIGVYDIQVYDFEFYPVEAYNNKPKDEKISATIIKILREFFSNELRILLYVCDSIDERGRERQLLFKFWYNYLADITLRHPLIINIENQGTAYGSVLNRNDFPHIGILQEHFFKNIQTLMEEKYGSN